MSQDKIIVGHEDLSRFIRAALEGKGARPEDAAVVADGLVWANCAASTDTAFPACRSIFA